MVLDGYIRVSQVNGRSGERFISPEVQRERIEGYAQLHGHTIGRVFEELDESGARSDRPLLLEALARQESGQAQVLAVAKLDRFGRSTSNGLAAIERVTEAGGAFISVADDFNFSTPTGRLLLRMMLSMGEWELDRVRAAWEDAQQRAIARGLFLGSVPLGYRRRANGRLTVDLATAPVARELFERRVAGATPTELAAWLSANGIPTPAGGRRWAYGTVKSLVGRRAYLGESTHGTFHNPAAHPALINPATWQAAQVKHQGGSGPRGFQPALLRGLLRCASCGRIMSTKVSEDQRLTYVCPRHSVAGSCPRPASVLDARVEPYAEAAMLGQLKGRGAARAQAAVVRAEAQATEAAEGLASYRDHPRLLKTLGPDRFDAGLLHRRALEENALGTLAEARSYAAQLLPGPAELRRRWPGMSLRAKRELIAAHLDCVIVFPGHGRDRLWAIPKGGQPAGLPPRAPRATSQLRAFSPSARQARALPAAGSLEWSRAKVTRALVPFLRERDRWPEFASFQQAGLALLHANALGLKPVRAWADQLGVARPPSLTSVPGWSEQRVREQLAVALAGREHWPTRREFADSGHSELRTAVQFHRGAAYWALEFGLTMRRQQPPRSIWTVTAMQEAVVELAGDGRRYPTREQFSTAGLSGLYSQILRSGARDQIAANLGLAVTKGGNHRAPTRWTEQAITEALDGLLTGADHYPVYDEWKARGLGGLHQVLGRKPGGHAAEAERFGLVRSRGLPRGTFTGSPGHRR